MQKDLFYIVVLPCCLAPSSSAMVSEFLV